MNRWNKKESLVARADERALFTKFPQDAGAYEDPREALKQLLQDICEVDKEYELKLRASLAIAKSPYARELIERLLATLRSLHHNEKR